MTITIHCITKIRLSLYNDQLARLMGIPFKISFTREPNKNIRLNHSPYSKRVLSCNEFTEVVARIETSKGTIRSHFLIASEIKNTKCTLRTDYHYPVLAQPDLENIDFQKLLRSRKQTRQGGASLPDSLRGFHHWLVSEIAESLNLAGYFSELHKNIETQYFQLEIIPTFREKIRTEVWGLAECD